MKFLREMVDSRAETEKIKHELELSAVMESKQVLRKGRWYVKRAE